ncbi:hypothetical protein V8G54_015271 [Vigna mungo]|uniref:Uncharacterized protein n=1 Tax=Vigna mungo TaxID=3915 RepID=A0AAQ3S011_VIGMU
MFIMKSERFFIVKWVDGPTPWSGFCFIWFFNFNMVMYDSSTNNRRPSEQHLGESERVFFVNSVLKLIDRGQCSKKEHLSETVVAATSILSYVEPSLVLPFVASGFHIALEMVSNAS